MSYWGRVRSPRAILGPAISFWDRIIWKPRSPRKGKAVLTELMNPGSSQEPMINNPEAPYTTVLRSKVLTSYIPERPRLSFRFQSHPSAWPLLSD